MIKLPGKALSALATAVAMLGSQASHAVEVRSPDIDLNEVTTVYSAHDAKYLRYNPPSGVKHAGNNMNWVYNDANRPASMPKATAIASIQNAMAKWSAVCGITFTYGGETSTPFSISYNGSPASSSYDGVKVVGWDTTMVAPTTGITFVAWSGTTFSDSEIRFNANYTVGFDFTALHEVGHALGLDHSDQNGAVMSGPPTSTYSSLSSLQADDIAGCVSLYGAAGGGGGGDTTAPSVPTSLNATPVSTTRIDLTWTASTDNVGVTAYNVFNGAALLGQVTSNSAQVTGLTPNSSYTFRVAACDAASNCSAQSSPVTASTLAPVADTQAPSVPANLSAVASGQSSVNLSWSASTDNVGVANYRVFNGASQVQTVTGTSASVTGLSASTTYTFRVSACDAAGNCSAQSSPASATTQAAVVDNQAPSVPTGLSASPASSSAINLAWNASTDNIGVTSYLVFRGGAQVATVSSPGTQVSGLAASTSYTFTVSACDGAGNCSAQSGQASATTLASSGGGGSAPAVPLNLTATVPNGNTVNLIWLASTDAASFRVFRDGVQVTTTTRSNFSVTGLQPNTTYSFTVQACSSGGACSAQSQPVIARTLGGTTTPSTNYQDLWWSPGQNGWGLTITQHNDALFIAMFIYDAAGKPTWVVMTSGTWDAAHTTYSGEMYIPTGSWFGNYDKSRFVVGTPAGSASFKFNNTNSATISYNILGQMGTKSIERLAFGVFDTTPATDYTDAWWAGAQENGWGLMLSQQFRNIFAAWYTYDASGLATWFIMSDGTWTSANTYTGKLYRTRGSQVLGASYNQAAFGVTEVGNLTLTFSSSGTGTMTYTVDGLTQTKAISRLAF